MTSHHFAAAPDALADRLARLGRGAGVDDRQAVLPDPLRVFHQRLLGTFLTRTGSPGAPVVADLAAELRLDPQPALAALAAADLVHTDRATGLSQAEAVQAAGQAFGGLLDPPNPQEKGPQ